MKKNSLIALFLICLLCLPLKLRAQVPVAVEETTLNHLGSMFLRKFLKAEDRYFGKQVAVHLRDVLLNGAAYLGFSLMNNRAGKSKPPGELIAISGLNEFLSDASFGARLREDLTDNGLVSAGLLRDRYRQALKSFDPVLSRAQNSFDHALLCSVVVISTASLPFALLDGPHDNSKAWGLSALGILGAITDLLEIASQNPRIGKTAAGFMASDKKAKERFLRIIGGYRRIIEAVILRLDGNLSDYDNEIKVMLAKIINLTSFFGKSSIADPLTVSDLDGISLSSSIPNIYTVFPRSLVLVDRKVGENMFIHDVFEGSTPIRIEPIDRNSRSVLFEVEMSDDYRIFGELLSPRGSGNAAETSNGHHVEFVTCKGGEGFVIQRKNGDNDQITVILKRMKGLKASLLLKASLRYDVRRDDMISGRRDVFDESGEFVFHDE